MVGKKLKVKGKIVAGKRVSFVNSENNENTIEEASSKPNNFVENDAKKTHSKNNFLLFSGIALLFLLVLFALWFFLFYNPYRYVFSLNGTLFVSNDNTPTIFLNKFSNEKEVVVSPLFFEGKTDASIVNASQLWIALLTYNNIKAIQLHRVVDEQKNLIECHTNWGDFNNSQVLDVVSCQELINDSSKAHVFIEPSSVTSFSLNNGNYVLLENKNIHIFYNNPSSASVVSFSVLEQLYPNARESLERINAIIGQIG